MHSLDIDIAFPCSAWPEEFTDLVERAVHKTLEAALPDFDGGEISIVMADDAFVQSLNAQYRGKDKPTNVLSFPQDEHGMLGDVILAYETVSHEAEQQNKRFEDHVTHLIVHGTLHLLGYDHIEDGEAEEMEALEIAILAAIGVKNPYEFAAIVS